MTRGVDPKTIASMRSSGALYLTSTCTVQRPTYAQDTAGQPIATWANVATLVKCGVVSSSQKFVSPDRGEYYATVYNLAVAYGTDVLKGDRIITIAGTITHAGPIHISAVLPAKALIPIHIALDTDYIPGSPA
jgi:head-tail adaptor